MKRRKRRTSDERLIELAADMTTAGLKRYKEALPRERRPSVATIGLDDYSLADARRDFRGFQVADLYDPRLAARLLRLERASEAIANMSKAARDAARFRVALISRVIGKSP